MKQDVQGCWTLEAVGDLGGVPEALRGTRVPATVPGCVHTDLLSAGLIPDPYLDQNELELSWIGRTDWRYSTTFAADDLLAFERLELVCEGLDTVATVELNGQHLASTQNMHRAYRFDVRPFLHVGDNTLSVTFAAPTTYGERERDAHGDLPNAYPTPFNFIRKMACNYGWDWGPILTTAGIWQPIYLEAWSTARIASVRPLVHLNDDLTRARVDVHADLGWADSEADVLLTAQLSGGYNPASITVPVNHSQAVLSFEVDNPELWWPRGHGEQPLYDLSVTLEQGDTQLSSATRRIGLRKTELDTSADDVGSAFTLKVNHKPIFCKGANWIPDDCFPTRITEARYRERITQAGDANMNMLRVWGGGIYESNAFYDICDELGVLVWQDFLFACAAYPEEEPYWSEVEAEARYQVTRLSSHASLALWNGNNENIWGYFDWGWQEPLEDRAWGKGYYLELLPRIVAELDPTRPYWPGSPYSGTFDLHPNADAHGTKHIWDVWNERDYTAYRDYQPRFAAEFGFQAPPTYATLRRTLSDTALTPDSPAMLHHQKAVKGQQKLQVGLEAHFIAPATFDDWLYLTQLNQARALRLGVEWFRSLAPSCMGTLYWQLNDCWPVTSWAAVDGYGRKKPLWYATKRFYADRLLTIQPRGDKLVLFACNDSDEVWDGEVSVELMHFTGGISVSEQHRLRIPPRSTEAVLEFSPSLSKPDHVKDEFLAATIGELKALWFFAPDKDLRYPSPDFDATLTNEGERYRLTLTAETLLRDVALFVDRLEPEATVSDQLVTLLPGESFTFEIHSAEPLSKEMLVNAPVFVCANSFGVPFREEGTSTAALEGVTTG